MSRKICQMHLIFQILESREERPLSVPRIYALSSRNSMAGSSSSLSLSQLLSRNLMVGSRSPSRLVASVNHNPNRPKAFRNSRAHTVSMAGSSLSSRLVPLVNHNPDALSLSQLSSRNSMAGSPLSSRSLSQLSSTRSRWRGVAAFPIAFRIS